MTREDTVRRPPGEEIAGAEGRTVPDVIAPRLLSPHEQEDLVPLGIGLTNLVDRATRAAADLPDDELREGARRLRGKVGRCEPRWLAFLGIGAYRTALGRPDATIGPQEERFGAARIWVLPNPSGLNAHYQLDDLVAAFADLRRAVEPPSLSLRPPGRRGRPRRPGGARPWSGP